MAQITKSDLLWYQLYKQYSLLKDEYIEVEDDTYNEINEITQNPNNESTIDGPIPVRLECTSYTEKTSFKSNNTFTLKSNVFLIYDDNSYEDVTTKCIYKLASNQNNTISRVNKFNSSSVEITVSTINFDNNRIIVMAEYKGLEIKVMSYLMKNSSFWYVGIEMPSIDNLETVPYNSAYSGWREIPENLNTYEDNPIFDGDPGIEVAPDLNTVDFYLLLPEGCYIKDAFGEIESGQYVKDMIIGGKNYKLYQRNGLDYAFKIYYRNE